MYFAILLKVAARSLLANKLRSFLAVLGIIIGVGAVIAMLGIGEGAQQNVVSRLQAMGTDLLMVRPGQRGSGGVRSASVQTLTVEDAAAILQVPGVLAVAPVSQGRAQVKYYDENNSVNILGSTPTYFAARNYTVEKGRAFTEAEAEGLARVAVIGPQTAKELLGGDDPLTATIKVKGINFRVIGVTAPKGDQGWYNPDDQVIVPYSTAMQVLFGNEYLNEIDVQGQPGVEQLGIQDGIIDLLRRRHRLQDDQENDFNVSNQAEIMSAYTAITTTLSMLLGSVGAISLVVGGIGIMNIMLVTVTERTREIGVRKAIGAKDRDILRQFLYEAIFMSTIGGILGVASGVGIGTLLSAYTQFYTIIKPESVLMALSFSAAVGIFFGYYPARRAAKLNPIEALRYE